MVTQFSSFPSFCFVFSFLLCAAICAYHLRVWVLLHICVCFFPSPCCCIWALPQQCSRRCHSIAPCFLCLFNLFCTVKYLESGGIFSHNDFLCSILLALFQRPFCSALIFYFPLFLVSTFLSFYAFICFLLCFLIPHLGFIYLTFTFP